MFAAGVGLSTRVHVLSGVKLCSETVAFVVRRRNLAPHSASIDRRLTSAPAQTSLTKRALGPWLKVWAAFFLGGLGFSLCWGAPSSPATAAGANTAVNALADKSQYTLFNPTPRALMREMSTDRPDLTETPYTVDAGHFQVEMDLFSHSQDHDTSGGEDTRSSSFAVATINLKVGLLNNLDLQVLVAAWNRLETRDRVRHTSAHQTGFGDVTPRLKINLWGNDQGRTAMAVMPFVNIPTHQQRLGNNAVEGGVILPLALELPRGFSLGLMSEYDINRNAAGRQYHLELVHTATLGRQIVGKLDGYIELFTLVSTEEDADWVGSVDFGLTYSLSPNIRLDAGVNIGVTPAADDWNPFVGLSFRF